MEEQWAPVWTKDDHEFIVFAQDLVGRSEEEAYQIQLGAMLVEGILLDMTPTFRAVRIDEGIWHREATLGKNTIGLISGPLLDECKKE